MYNTSDAEKSVYSVSQLSREVRSLLELSYPCVWVTGEISNARAPGSGHWYFSLKDGSAQIRCAMFRLRASALGFQPRDGLQVLARAKISLYEERGDFQLIIEHLEEAGDGALRRAFELLKSRLDQEGLFAAQFKKPLPTMPKRIGVITSPTGAAIRDILSVLRRRFASIAVVIYPVAVQGAQAAGQICQALQLANERQECDVLILARGGGSLEDLWPFNEESVARAIHASVLPVITGVGHEIDFTIADFVADQRAATPSAAAELASPLAAAWLDNLQQLEERLHRYLTTRLQHHHLVLQHLIKRLPHPLRRLQDQAQRVDDISSRLQLAYRHFLKQLEASLSQAQARLQQQMPQQRLLMLKDRCQALSTQLKTHMQHQLWRYREQLVSMMRSLDVVSPLNTLDRGYAILTRESHVISDVMTVEPGDRIEARLAHGQLQCRVERKITPDPS